MKPPLVLIKRDRTVPTPHKFPAEHHAYTPPVKLSPIAAATHHLASRLEDRGEAGYYLDGQPARLDAIMRATNRVLKSKGKDQITTNPRWVCD